MEASLDAAVLTPSHSPPVATGVEICKCPPEYNSTSCQDPSIGYYRWYNNNIINSKSSAIIELVGHAKQCECSGRSEICDKETGECLVMILLRVSIVIKLDIVCCNILSTLVNVHWLLVVVVG